MNPSKTNEPTRYEKQIHPDLLAAMEHMTTKQVGLTLESMFHEEHRSIGIQAHEAIYSLAHQRGRWYAIAEYTRLPQGEIR